MFTKYAGIILKSLATSSVVRFMGNIGVAFAPDPVSKIGLYLVTTALSSQVTKEITEMVDTSIKEIKS